MAGEPTTVNVGLIIPNTGDLVNLWGAQAINPDMAAIDGFQGGVQTIPVAATPVTLTVPAGFTATPGAGPTQAQNAVLRFTGALTSSVSVTLPMPGYYIIENLTTGNFLLGFRGMTATEFVFIPQGSVRHIYNDGANVRFVNLPDVGSYLDLATSTVPAWITNCSKPPYLLCDGSTFSAVTYPYLNSYLGSTTLPDFRGRNAFFMNGGSTRLTSAGAGIDGNTLFAVGNNNGVSLAANQIPTISSVTSGVITVNFGKNVPSTAGSIIGAQVNNGQGPLQANYPTSTSGGAGDWANLSSASTSGAVTVSYTNSSQVIVPATAPGVVGGIRLIRAA